MSINTKNIAIFAGSASLELAGKIAEALGINLGDMQVEHFADGEFSVYYKDSIRGKDVFLVQSTYPSSDNIMELLLMVDAAKRASAHYIAAVIPYFGWARQDRKDKPRVSIGAKLMADLLSTAGVTRVITMDLHADQIQGFFNVPVDHLYASMVFIDYLRQTSDLERTVIATPDVGGAKRANSYAKFLGVPMVICHKSRAKANEVAEMTIIGDVTDKDVILVDDIVDTAGTICKAADLMIQNGARSVRAVASHAVLSDPATERINASALKEMIFTDSIPLRKHSDKIHIVSVANIFAEAINRVINHESTSILYSI